MAEAKYPRDLQTTVFGVATALKRNPQIGPAGPHLIIPCSPDTNDMRFFNPQGFGGGDEFFTYLKDSFDVLYAECDTAPGAAPAADRAALARPSVASCR